MWPQLDCSSVTAFAWRCWETLGKQVTWLGFKPITSQIKVYSITDTLICSWIIWHTVPIRPSSKNICTQMKSQSNMNYVHVLAISLLLQNYPRIMVSPFVDMACFVPPVGQYNILIVPAKFCQTWTTFNIKPMWWHIVLPFDMVHRLYQGIVQFKNVIWLYSTHVNVITFMSIRNEHPSLHWFP